MPAGRPLLSVVIATFNRAEVITRAVDSVLAQDYPCLEVVVVDDGSTDCTPSVMASYAESAVRYIRQENRERGAARNAGLAASHGSFVCFFDSDDEMLDGHLGPLVEALEADPAAGLAYREAQFHDDATGRVFDVFPRVPVAGTRLVDSAMRNFMALGSVLVRRSLLDEVGWFDEDRQLSGCEDWELWTRCLSASPVTFVAGATVRIHYHSSNTVRDTWAMERAIRCANAKMLSHPRTAPALGPHRRRLRAGMWAFVAHNHMLAGDGRSARACLREGYREDPRVVLESVWTAMAVKALAGPRVVGRLRATRSGAYLRRRSHAVGAARSS